MSICRVQQCYRRVMLDQWTAFQNLTPTLPTVQFSHIGTRQFIRLHASSSEATKCVILLFSHMLYYSPRPVNTLECVKWVELPFKNKHLNHYNNKWATHRPLIQLTHAYLYIFNNPNAYTVNRNGSLTPTYKKVFIDVVSIQSSTVDFL